MRALTACLAWAFIHLSYSVSTKMDFGEDATSVVTNSSKNDDDDVEVKHTIVVSTKLKNNRKGVRSNNDDGTLTYNVGEAEPRKEKDDSGEVPIVYGTKSIETTRIRTPDTRYKNKAYPDSGFVNRNIRDEYDIYPNVATNPNQWRPSNFYNNINYRQPDGRRESYDNDRRRAYQNPGKLHRKMTDEGMRDFYCKKCLEYSNAHGFKCAAVVQQPIHQRSANSWMYETTTAKVKIDGKLAKLN